jgi:hypothetical protein
MIAPASGKGDRQRVFCLGSFKTSKLKPDAINDLRAFGNAPIGAPRGRRNIVTNLFVFLVRNNGVSRCADLLSDALQRVKRGVDGRGAEDMVGDGSGSR